MASHPRAGRATIAGLALVLTVAVGAPSAATTPSSVRYASPDGTGSTCTRAAPCDLVTAVNDADADSEIVITAGSYGSPAHPLATTLEDNAADLDIHGALGAQMPRIYSAPSGDAVELTQGSVLSKVEIITSAGAYGVVDTASADHLFVVDTATSGTACAVYGTLSDSLCLATGSNGTGVGLTVTAVTTTTVTGVTAEAPGMHGTGLSAASATATVAFSVFGTNDIAHGGGVDIAAHNGGSPVTVGLRFSDYSSITTSGVASVLNDPTNLNTPATFINRAGRNYHEAPGSATIDAGTAAPRGDTDLAGLPRTLGPATDMGAYEYAPPPSAHDLRVTKRTRHTLHVAVVVNPHGTAARVLVVATHNGHRHTSAIRQAGHGVDGSTIRLTLHNLTAKTIYDLHALATNAGGHTATGHHTARTR